MAGFEILDLLIGMFFIYFLLGLICSSLQEIRARVKNLRAKNLKKWVQDTFPNDFGKKLLKNVLIDGLTQDGRSPSYLSKGVFTGALLEEIHFESKNEDNQDSLTPYDFNSLGQSIRSSSLPIKIKAALLQSHSESFQNLDHFKQKIGIWFDQAMERNAGTFKKDAQNWVLIFSILITIALNVDSLKLIRYFYENPEASRKIAETAEQVIKDKEAIERVAAIRSGLADTLKFEIRKISERIEEIQSLKKKLDNQHLPVGWDFTVYKNFGEVKSFLFWFLTFLGWTITTMALSLGAVFWFDTLNKLVNLRSAGKKPLSTAESSPTKPTDLKDSENVLG